MSEKRFVLWRSEDRDGYTDEWAVDDKLTGKRIDEDEVVDLLNEQQATISKLQDLCGKSDYENAKLRLKNKELQEEIKLLKPTNVEQYEQIVQLQKENEQLRENIKDFEELMKKVK